ncbi:MAG TPA: DUF5916 domain-containing protein [Xanthomonadaceae bacterium]|nr:DUF5916 domain-containing protein [Xanthomonadaceae bacterium]
MRPIQNRSRCRLLGLVLLAVLTVPAHAVEIDGRIDPAEWQGAQRVTDFKVVQPLTGAAPAHPVEGWILATPEGLAVAWRVSMPPDVPRSRQPVQRDFEAQVDRVNFNIDFDGDGRTAYNFCISSTNGIGDGVFSNENAFNDDWDGNWKHAVSEDDQGWTAEALIPWYIAPMRQGTDGRRRVKVNMDRVIGATGERAAWPAVTFERSRFVSDFIPIEVAEYSQSLLAVTPYVSGLYDNVDGRSEFDGGADLFWKPNGQFQLSATLNPDFGQVESDDLVVNFSATETFISDKRPFFTENQGIFEYTTPSDFSQLLYTRRAGGPADDGNGAGDIAAAVKLNGNLGAAKYGVFYADERGDVGRSFGALRLVRDFSEQNLGMMLTQVERPYLDREATVLGIDHDWRPTPRWNIRSRLFGSRIDQDGQAESDLGATVWADYEMDRGWRQQWIAMHFGNALQINDAGYLSRNSLNYLHWQASRRFTDLPEDSRYASKDWRWRISGTDNNHGDRLQRQFRMSRDGQLRNGSSEYAQINVNSSGVDDQITRGNGNLRRPSNFNAYYEYGRPRKGSWAWETEVEAFSGGLAGNDKIGYRVEFSPTYFINDAFSIIAGLSYERTPDWLVWQCDDPDAACGNRIGRFDEQALELDAGVNWNIGSKQELRVKLQALGLDAALQQVVRVQPDGSALAVDEAVDDFNVRTLGFQIRYRYELAPLSYLYVVYGRGGYRQDPYSDDVGNLLGDSFDIRDDEQLLVKLSYRFEL